MTSRERSQRAKEVVCGLTPRTFALTLLFQTQESVSVISSFFFSKPEADCIIYRSKATFHLCSKCVSAFCTKRFDGISHSEEVQVLQLELSTTGDCN